MYKKLLEERTGDKYEKLYLQNYKVIDSNYKYKACFKVSDC